MPTLPQILMAVKSNFITNYSYLLMQMTTLITQGLTERSWEVTVKLKVFSCPIIGSIGLIGGGFSSTPKRKRHV